MSTQINLNSFEKLNILYALMEKCKPLNQPTLNTYSGDKHAQGTSTLKAALFIVKMNEVEDISSLQNCDFIVAATMPPHLIWIKNGARR
ncbi:MAG: hypothetical protein ACSLEL_00335 [Candidatus Malihini olakiniferum]